MWNIYTRFFKLRRFHCILYIYSTIYTLLQNFFANITQFHVIDLVCKYKQLSLEDDYHIFIKSEISLFSRFWQLIYAMRPSSINSREKYLWRCLCVTTMNIKIKAKCIKKRNVLLWKYTSCHTHYNTHIYKIGDLHLFLS